MVMKKIYKQPMTAVINMTPVTIIAISENVKLDKTNENRLTDSNEILTKGSGDWDPWEE